MFDSTKQTLKTLLEQIAGGSLQLPEFQRDYVWTEEAVVSLLASVAKGYPVGALLTLERGGDVDFKPRPIQGAGAGAKQPEHLLLDGQQRMTSLFQTLFNKKPALVKNAKGDRVARHFYVDIVKAVSFPSSFEDAIEVVPETRCRMKPFGREVDLDLSSRELEFEQNMFPLDATFDSRSWFYGWHDHWKTKGLDTYERERAFEQQVLDRIQRYEMPIIRLFKSNSREAVCTIFEKVNVGGVKLDAFELVTAIFAGTGKGFDLRHDWFGSPAQHGRLGRIRGERSAGIYAKLASTDFLQACTLLHTMERREASKASGTLAHLLPQVSCKREAILALPLDAYIKYAGDVEAAFVEAGRFLAEQRIVYDRDLPYPPQVVALAAFFAKVGSKADNAAIRESLARWFWSGVLGEYYGGGTETKIARDVPQLLSWLTEGGPKPQIFGDIALATGRFNRLKSRRAAAYKGFHALLMREGCRDFVSGKGFDLSVLWQDPIDIHHIFPQSWCRNSKKEPEDYDTILNKTPLSPVTNRYIVRGDAPSVYLKRIETDHNISPEALDAILRSHLIEPGLLRADNFEGFIADRKSKLASLAASVIGESVIDQAEAEGTSDQEDFPTDELEAA